jgi:hypothetical protein
MFANSNLPALNKPYTEDKDAWVAAIKKDGLEWPQVADLKYLYNYVATLYDIKSVPINFLIDPSGKVVAKNLRREELLKKLDELLKLGN